MKSHPELLIWIVPLSICCGIALAISIDSGATLAWCAATGFGVLCCGLVLLSFIVSRSTRSQSHQAALKHFFKNWPRDLDILHSEQSDEIRALSAQRIGRQLGDPNWEFRDDAYRALVAIIERPETSPLTAKAASAALDQIGKVVSPSAGLEKGESSSERPEWEPESNPRISDREFVFFHAKELEPEPVLESEEFEKLFRQWKEGLGKPFEERPKLSARWDELNQKRLQSNLTRTIQDMVDRSIGKDWLDIDTRSELAVVFSEPWVSAMPETMRVGPGKLTVALWPLVIEETMISPRRDIRKLLGQFGRQLLNLEKEQCA